MLFLSLMHMAGGLNVQKGLCEGISRKLELCTSPDTGTCPKQLAASPFFHFHSLPPHSSSTFSPSPCFFFFLFHTLSSLSITLLHLQMWHCLDTFVLLRQTADLPKADVMIYSKKKTMSSLEDSLSCLSWGEK